MTERRSNARNRNVNRRIHRDVCGARSNLGTCTIYNLNNIKAKTVGDGQHGTARWARKGEIEKTYRHIPFTPELWRKGKNLPKPEDQGIVVGCNSSATGTTALVDTGDVHALMIGAAGVGKTAYFLYPNLEYACASEMSFVTSDTKGDLYRHYGKIAKEHYGYNVAVIDLRNPTKSDGNNLLHLVNKYMDLWKAEPDNLAYKAKAEKYAKIISKTIIMSGMDGASFGQNAFFYDAAEGLLTASILMVFNNIWFSIPKKLPMICSILRFLTQFPISQRTCHMMKSALMRFLAHWITKGLTAFRDLLIFPATKGNICIFAPKL